MFNMFEYVNVKNMLKIFNIKKNQHINNTLKYILTYTIIIYITDLKKYIQCKVFVICKQFNYYTLNIL